MTIAELFARIGIKADDSQIKRFSGTMKAAKVGMIALSASAVGTALAIKKITSEAMAASVAFKQFEIETGSSAQELQKWQSVAEQTNQSAESVTSAIKSIVANQEKIRLGQGNLSGYQLLGIDPRQDPFKILEELRVKSKNLSEGMRKNVLQQMGVGVGLLQTLKLTRDEFDAMSARAFIISPQAIETLNNTKASVDLAARGIGYMKAQIAVGLSPQITALTKKFTEFLKVNEKAIIEGFKKAFTFVEKFTTAIARAAKMINTVVTNTIGWEGAIIALAAAFVILNSTLILSPIGLITAGIIALILVLEDLYVYSKGGKSLFGVLMDEFPGLKTLFDGIMKPIKEVYELIKAFSEGDRFKIDSILEQWGLLGDIIQGILDTLEKISEWGKKSEWDPETGESGNVSGFLNRQIEGNQGFKDFIADPLSWFRDAGLILTGRGDQTVNNNVDVKVWGVESPEETGEAVNGALRKGLIDAYVIQGRNE